MGISTVTAARIMAGQKQGGSGEAHQLAFEKFPFSAYSKTYTLDMQVGDSGACATALLSGVKGNFETIGLDSRGRFKDCGSTFTSRVSSIMDWAQEVGKSNGFVTNTRITHATPAALYAHSASRYWEDDSKMPKDGAESCKDIAKQLIEDQPGKDIKVLLGGGKRHLIPRSDGGVEGES